MRRLRKLAALAGVGALLAMPTAASAATTSITSSNWAGYVVSGTTYSSVSGTWVVPKASSSTEGYSATWIGLGGSDSSSDALEQAGTESDYANGKATYSAWYELVPRGPVTLKLSVHAGDKVSAKVSVSGTTVTVTMSDLTTGTTITKTLHTSDIDTSSAEWITEAPSEETPDGNYQVVPLADFGKVTFSGATATSTAGHTGTISDSAWSAQRVDLVSDTFGGFDGFHHRGGPQAQSNAGEATTSSLSSAGSRFAVTWNAAD